MQLAGAVCSMQVQYAACRFIVQENPIMEQLCIPEASKPFGSALRQTCSPEPSKNEILVRPVREAGAEPFCMEGASAGPVNSCEHTELFRVRYAV